MQLIYQTFGNRINASLYEIILNEPKNLKKCLCYCSSRSLKKKKKKKKLFLLPFKEVSKSVPSPVRRKRRRQWCSSIVRGLHILRSMGVTCLPPFSKEPYISRSLSISPRYIKQLTLWSKGLLQNFV